MGDRKRSREDEGEEFFPLSKRINQLNIHSHSEFAHPNIVIPKEPKNSSYDPELTQLENPHYYYRNKMLFEAFQERKTRLAGNE